MNHWPFHIYCLHRVPVLINVQWMLPSNTVNLDHKFEIRRLGVWFLRIQKLDLQLIKFLLKIQVHLLNCIETSQITLQKVESEFSKTKSGWKFNLFNAIFSMNDLWVYTMSNVWIYSRCWYNIKDHSLHCSVFEW